MLAIGRAALMANPKVLLLDEPLLGLSPASQKIVIEAIKEIRKTRGITIIVSEQYSRPVIPIIDSVISLKTVPVFWGDKRRATDNPRCQIGLLWNLRSVYGTYRNECTYTQFDEA